MINFNPSEKDFQLAGILLDHSLQIKPKEKVLISVSEGIDNPLIKAVYIEALKRGAYPLIDGGITNFYLSRNTLGGLSYQMYKYGNNWQQNYAPKEVINSMIDWADAYVRITSITNKKEFNQIEPELLSARKASIQDEFVKLVNSDRWVLTFYPNAAMAQEAGVALDWLVDFYYEACIVDYNKMKLELLQLEKVLDQGREIHVLGKETDLYLQINGRQAKAAYGKRNIPDGEVFLAPLKEGVNGSVYFDLPTIYHGHEVKGIRLRFKNGKVIKASAESGEDSLKKFLATDEGSRYLGEFAIGANYKIKTAMKETLFDEKIGGTIHMALGKSYAEKRGGAVSGGNVSAIHWDIVKDMRNKDSIVTVDGKKVLIAGKIVV